MVNSEVSSSMCGALVALQFYLRALLLLHAAAAAADDDDDDDDYGLLFFFLLLLLLPSLFDHALSQMLTVMSLLRVVPGKHRVGLLVRGTLLRNA